MKSAKKEEMANEPVVAPPAIIAAWQVIARSQEKTEQFVKFTAEAFYKSYS